VDVKGNNLILIGDNGVGKSSFMQFIEIALGKNTNIPPNALGEGEVIVDRNGLEYKFQVKIKDGKSKIIITTPDGMRDDRKGTIANLIGAIDFDINEFVSLSESVPGRRKQVEIFKSLLPTETIEFFNTMENKIKMDETDRTEVGRKIKAIEGSLKENPLYGSHLTIEKIEIGNAQEELQKATTHNSNVDRISNGIDRKLSELDELKAKVAILEKEIVDGKAWLEKNQPIDTAALFDKINNASEQNTKWNEAQRIIGQEKELQELQSEYGDLGALVNSSKEAIQDAIRDMDSPVDGLSFDNENLIYNGHVVSESTLATSEIIELGVKLKMAQNKDFGVLFIEHGESLGEKRLKDIQNIAAENNWQIIMEQVQRGTGKLQIEIMEG
jgi:hypothetical protein